MSIASRVRWTFRHGLARLFLRRAAHRGDIGARLVVEQGLQDDPFPYYDAMRAEPFRRGPLALNTARHDVATTVLRSERFGVERDFGPLPGPVRFLLRAANDERYFSPVDPPSMLAVDPPDHTRYRKLVTRVFTARAIEGLRGRTEAVAHELLDELAADARPGGDPVDLVARYASLLPVTVIAEILGVPTGMRSSFLRWGGGAAATLDIGINYRTFRRAERDVQALDTWMRGHFDDLRRTPGPDILSQLVALVDGGGQVDGEDELDGGERLSEAELSAIAMLLLGAGFETTVNLIGNGVTQLLAHPDQRDALRADPGLWANAVEEILRYDSPVQRTARITKQDTEVAGVAIPTGTIVVVLIGGANRDPAVFADPHRFDITRANARDHLAFSSGIHYCVGASLARLEGEIGLRALFDRFGELALAGPPHRRPTRTLRGYDAMPAHLGPANTPKTPANPEPAGPPVAATVTGSAELG